METPGPPHLPPAAAPTARLPVPAARAGAGPGRGGRPGRARASGPRRDDNAGEGRWGRAPTRLRTAGFQSPVLGAASSRARRATALSSQLLLAGPAVLKGPTPPRSRWGASTAKGTAVPATRGQSGRSVDPGLGGWRRRADLNTVRAGELKSLGGDRSLDYRLDDGGVRTGNGVGIGVQTPSFSRDCEAVRLSAPLPHQFSPVPALELRLPPAIPQTR